MSRLCSRWRWSATRWAVRHRQCPGRKSEYRRSGAGLVGGCPARRHRRSVSPALIEQSRSAVTDSAGRYAIVDLRPGTYAVTFTLAGFKTVRREGIVLEGAFAAAGQRRRWRSGRSRRRSP